VSLPVDVVVVDVPAWLEVAANLPLAGAVPAGLAGLPPADAGDPASPVEALVGAATLARLGLAPGGVGQLTVGDRTATVRVAGTPEVIPGLGAADEIVVLDRAAADAALPGIGANPWAVFLRAPGTASEGLAAEVGRYAPEVILASRGVAREELRAAPLARAIRAGFGVALAVALLYALAVVALASRRAIGARRRELAVLRVLGLPARGLAGLLALEVAPLVVAALVAGAGLGVLIAALVLPDLAITQLVGPGGVATLAGDPALLLLLAAAPVFGAAAAILVGVRGIRRGDLADATRAVEP
jgi:putative ABC transport system permease protein